MIRSLFPAARLLPASSLVLFSLFGFPVAAGTEPEPNPSSEPRGIISSGKDLDLRSGNRALRELFETSDLGPLRKRGAEIGSREVLRERERTTRQRAVAAATPTWVSLGPTYRSIARGTPGNAGDNSGLASGIAVHPTDPATLWLATSGGGIWKTSDGGASWRALTDLIGPTPTGAVAVSPSNPNRLYAGTGCGDSSSSYQSAAGFGILISDDGGASWRVSSAGTGPGNVFFELSVDPGSPDTLLAASDKGVSRSTDGGESWKLVVPIPAYSLSRSLADPRIVFAGTWKPPLSGSLVSQTPGSIWKSTDGGATFVEKASGLPGPSSTRARPEVAVAPSDPARVYALFSDTSSIQIDMTSSTDGGESWAPLGLSAKGANILGSQGNYFSVVAVDPSNPNVVYAGGLDLWKSADAGATWNRVSRWQGIGFGLPYVHADQHAIAFGPGGAVWFATDGGLYRSTDAGLSFTSHNRGLVTMQFYRICTTPAAPDLILGGAQDNGTSQRVGGSEYREVIGGDGFGCIAHPSNPLILHGSLYLEYIARSTDGGASWKDATQGLTDAGDETLGWFTTILKRHPIQSEWIYTSSLKKLWESKNGATTWRSPSGEIPVSGLVAIRDFSFLPTDGSRIAIAANAGLLLESTDGGVTFQKVGTLPVNTLMAVRYDRTDARTLYVASALVTPGAQRVFVSHDGGATWQPLSKTGQPGGLPDLPVMTLEQDPSDPNVLWAGTYVGVYRSPDRGATWSRFGAGLPNVMAMSIEITPDGKRLRLGTFGRGIWEIETGAVAQNSPPTVRIDAPSPPVSIEAGNRLSFAGSGSDPDSGDAVSLSWSFGDGTAGAAGASVDHWFARPGAYQVTLTGTDLNGASSTATVTVTVTTSTVTGASLLVPVVLESGSVGGAYYTSELTVASRRAAPVELLLTYTASAGGGSGVARLSLAPGQQVVLPSILSWLRGRGLLIPEGSATRIGTLLVTASGSADTSGLFVGARTSTPDPKGLGGTFGLFYPALSLEESATQVAYLHALQQTDLQRSNVAVVNRGDALDSITLRVIWLGPDGKAAGSPDEQALPPGGWFQFPQPLASRGLSAGQARIEKVSGASRFVVYGVLNDATTTDGSYLPMSK